MKPYLYHLPPERIAIHPLPKRDVAKLLLYKDGDISESTFGHLPKFLPHDSLLVFNDTKVIRARILFQTPEGKEIEIFCLEALSEKSGSAMWQCLIGNNRAWKSGTYEMVLKNKEKVSIVRQCDTGKEFVVEFSWDSQKNFIQILEEIGHVPLPPYMKRSDELGDQENYQTIFARNEGAVAAPTASLHVTSELLDEIRVNGAEVGYITLHVGAGTFLPITAEDIEDHVMHGEVVHITKSFLQNLIHHIENKKPVIASGTTVLRTLESLYWKSLTRNAGDISQWIWKEYQEAPTVLESLHTTLTYMQENNLDEISFRTYIMIVPGYDFKVVDALITNFHQPGSTLLLLVAALVGEDWKNIYQYALAHDFRFLSYGDGSLLWKSSAVAIK